MTTDRQDNPIFIRDEQTLVFILDLRDPFSFLALDPAIQFSTRAASIDWLPIRKHTLRPPSPPRSDDDRSILHRRARAQMIAREIAVYSERRGINLASPYRDGHADATYAAWLWVRSTKPDRLPAFLTTVFEAYWTENLDPENQNEILTLLDRHGLDGADFSAWASSNGETALRALESQLAEVGISQAPAYLIKDEIFYGRQHLPMIRWIIEGRQGNPPI